MSSTDAQLIDRRDDRFAAGFVWSVWAGLTLIWLALVAIYASPFPHEDDWAFIAPPPGTSYSELIWTAYNGVHRTPITVLLIDTVWRAAGNLKLVQLLNVGVLSGAAALMLHLVRRWRGRLEYSDAVLPLVALSFVSAINVYWAVQLYVITAAMLGAMLLATCILLPEVLRRREAIVITLGLVLLTLHGGPGLTFTPPLLVAFLAAALQQFRARRPERGVILLVGIAVAASVFLFNLLTMERDAGGAPRASLAAAVSTLVQLLSYSLGLPGKSLHPASGLFVIALLALAAGLALWQLRRTPLMLLRIGAALAAPLSLMAGLAISRAGSGFALRYGTMLLPLLLAIYIALLRLLPVAWFRPIGMALLLVSSAGIFTQLQHARDVGMERRQTAMDFRAAVAAGHPVSRLAADFAGPDLLNREDEFRRILDQMRTTTAPVYRDIAADPPMRIEPLNSPAPAGDVPHRLIAHLPTPRRILAVRLVYEYRDIPGSRPLTVRWRGRDDIPWEAAPQRTFTVNTRTAQRVKTQTIWIDSEVRSIAIDPSAVPGQFVVHRAELLLTTGQ